MYTFENLSCMKSSFVFIDNIENSIKTPSKFVTCNQELTNYFLQELVRNML